MRKPKFLFQKVKCRGYLAKIRDGVYIEIIEKDGNIEPHGKFPLNDQTATAYCYGGKTKDLSDFDGSGVTKTYRKRVETEFTGILVGYTDLLTDAFLGTDTVTEYNGMENGIVFREEHTQKVGIVYYQNNRKRYVLLDDIIEGTVL